MEIKDLKIGMELKDVGNGEVYEIINMYSYRVMLQDKNKDSKFYPIDYVLKYFVEAKKEVEFNVGDYGYYLNEHDEKYHICKIEETYGDNIRGAYFVFNKLPTRLSDFNIYGKNIGHGLMPKEELTKLVFIENKTVKPSIPKTKSIKFNYKENKNIKVINGAFKGLTGTILAVFTNTNRVNILINGDIENVINLKLSDIEVVKDIKPNEPLGEIFRTVLHIGDNKYNCRIKIKGFMTTVELMDENVKASVIFDEDNIDLYNKEDGIDRAFKKALVKYLKKEINK